MIKGLAAAAGAFAALAAAGSAVSGLGPILNPPHAPPGLEAHETHAAASLLGQFRTSVSAWLWLRTDLYLHNGVQMRPMTAAEQGAGVQAGAPSHDDHGQIQDESRIVSVIPPKERDFRGWLGDLEREVGAYSDMHGHHHNDPKATMPLFRLMTWIDPDFIKGWTVGSMILEREPGSVGLAKSLAYLKEGLRANPESIAILVELGRIEASLAKRPDLATTWLEQARALARIATLRDLSEDDRDALDQGYRWLTFCYRDLGEHRREIEAAREGLASFPDDMVLLREAVPPPSILTEKARSEWLQAAADALSRARR